MKKLFGYAAAACIAAVSCSGGNEGNILGAWVEPVGGMEGMVQGFVLREDGSASSVNMSTLVYESWRRCGDTLMLKGKSIGNRQTLPFEDTMLIKSVSDSVLTVARIYDGEVSATETEYSRSIAASDTHNASNSLDYAGTYKGVLPAADCPGINYVLDIFDDGTYSLEMTYIDRDAVFTENGTYKVEGNYLYATDGEGTCTKYKVEENRIRCLDGDGNVIKGDLEQMYILTKEQ